MKTNITFKDDYKVVYKIGTEQGIGIEELTSSLSALNNQYQRYIKQSNTKYTDKEIKLLVKEVKPGSQVYEIIPYIVGLAGQLNFLSGLDLKTIISYVDYLKTFYSYLKGETKNPPHELEKKDYINAKQILNVAKLNGNNLTINAQENSNIVNNFYVSPVEANALQNIANERIEQIEQPKENLHKQVVLYLFQARNTANSKKGDKGIIEEISTEPKNIIFSDDIKSTIISLNDNIFNFYFEVDAEIVEIEGKIRFYRIKKLHKHFEKEN